MPINEGNGMNISVTEALKAAVELESLYKFKYRLTPAQENAIFIAQIALRRLAEGKPIREGGSEEICGWVVRDSPDGIGRVAVCPHCLNVNAIKNQDRGHGYCVNTYSPLLTDYCPHCGKRMK